MAQQTDSVCGMQIEESEAAGQSEYQGRTFYFCSTACQNKFEQNPEQYANESERR